MRAIKLLAKFSCFAVLGLTLAWQSAWAKESVPNPKWTQLRIQSAQTLISQDNDFISKANDLKIRLANQLLVANKLKGEVEVFKNNILLPPTAKLSPQEYKAALTQYNLDLAKFAEHAKAYQSQVQEFQQLAGECHANEAAYQALVKQYELHCHEFHLPNIQPPHICPTLGLTHGEASHIANQMRADFMRVAQAQSDLQAAEGRLSQARAEAGYAENKSLLEAERQHKEQQLASQFGALSQEHALLTIEKQTLDNGIKTANSQLVRSKVSGKITGKSKK